MRREDIPSWCFLVGQFLLRFENNKNEMHYLNVHRDFLNSIETAPPLHDFSYINPPIVIMLCYGLLVYPVEFWEKFLENEIRMKVLDKTITAVAQVPGISIETFQDLFHVIKPDVKPLSKADFIRKLRNSIAHAHIDVDIPGNLYTFWNINKKDETDFKVTTSTEKLGIFLTGLGRYFGNHEKNIK